MSPEQFDDLIRQGYNRIPLVREVLADLDTPLSTYLKLGSGPYSYLLESVQGGREMGPLFLCRSARPYRGPGPWAPDLRGGVRPGGGRGPGG